MILGVEKFLTLDASEWTAIGTVVLSVMTIAYVIVTWRIAKSASKSAASSKEAAEAAARSARVAEAGLHVDFEAHYDRESSALGNRWIILESRGANVYFHGAGVDIAAVHLVGKKDPEIVVGGLDVEEPPDERPFLLHRDEWVHLGWPFGDVDPDRPGTGVLLVQYSLDAGEPPRDIRRPIDFGTPEDKTFTTH